MNIKLTPIALATVVLMHSQAYADGSVGANTTTQNINVLNEVITGPAGSNAGTVSNQNGGAGIGGSGGGSVIGGVSQGGPGGKSGSGSTSPTVAEALVSGGGGGNVLKNTIAITDSTLKGTDGGRGGSMAAQNAEGGAGAGGIGGGSVLGGISQGGAGGYSRGIYVSNAGGGAGGSVSGNTIAITRSTLDGAAGGTGGSATVGGTGIGGLGGGSVSGGISQGGAGGYAYGATATTKGGAGGDVTNNTIRIISSTLNGAVGGAGGTINAGGGGAGGHGGGSVFGGISQGGAGGQSRFASYNSYATGGAGGNVTGNNIWIEASFLIGATGGNSHTDSFGGVGTTGSGGGSVFGGISQGGAGGTSDSGNNTPESRGGSGGNVTDNTIQIMGSTLTGARGSNGGNGSTGGATAGGLGGGSVFGGLSQGGAGGNSYKTPDGNGGGAGGLVAGNNISIYNSVLDGAAGGDGSSASNAGGSGEGGFGGGSVFGGVSLGGSGGAETSGGVGGNVTGNTITINGSTLNGAAGGDGGSSLFTLTSTYVGGSGAGGHGGGSIFGGISQGGGGGSSYGIRSLNGGAGGNVTANKITITDSTLIGAAGGAGGSSLLGGAGMAGLDGGSVFGGVSQGGAGGFTQYEPSVSIDGGAGGSVSNNQITISGTSKISGDIYGGVSRGGMKGKRTINGVDSFGQDGKGGVTQNNTITLIGDNLTIGGSLYGGMSKNGDGSQNFDADYTSFYQGNTLQIRSGRINVKGIQNFEYYNWLLPQDEFDGDVVVNIDAAGIPVNINNTIHKVDVDAEGNKLNAGDTVVLIDRVTGGPKSSAPTRGVVEQGFFIVYDAEMKVDSDQLVLKVLGINDGIADGRINPESEAFLKGRIAQLAVVDQGADMISDGVWSARASLREKNANLFIVTDGGSSRYETGQNSHVKLNDIKFAVGAGKAFTMNDQSALMVGFFAEHGSGKYNSNSDLTSSGFGQVHGSGNASYNGVGALFHVDVANTDLSRVKNKPNIFDSKYGLYVHGALRFGYAKVDFQSSDIVNGYGVEGRYNTKSRYMTAMAGAGYVLTLSHKKAMDFYGRYTFSRLNGNDVLVVDEQMSVGAAHSHRLRLGARYGYAYSEKVTSYAGLAYERNFNGDVSGSAYGFTIKENSLQGNTGILELGVMVKPKGVNDPFSLNLGLQGYLGDRKGVTAAVRARYVF